jgi:hypothetical protein
MYQNINKRRAHAQKGLIPPLKLIFVKSSCYNSQIKDFFKEPIDRRFRISAASEALKIYRAHGAQTSKYGMLFLC